MVARMTLDHSVGVRISAGLFMNAEKTLSMLALDIAAELEYAYEIQPRLGCGADPMYCLKSRYEIAQLMQKSLDSAIALGPAIVLADVVKLISQDLCQYYTMRRREGGKESFLQIIERVMTEALEGVR